MGYTKYYLDRLSDKENDIKRITENIICISNKFKEINNTIDIEIKLSDNIYNQFNTLMKDFENLVERTYNADKVINSAIFEYSSGEQQINTIFNGLVDIANMFHDKNHAQTQSDKTSITGINIIQKWFRGIKDYFISKIDHIKNFLNGKKIRVNNKDYSKAKNNNSDIKISYLSSSQNNFDYTSKERITKIQQFIKNKGINIEVTGELDRATFQASLMVGINELKDNGFILEDSYPGNGLNLYSYEQNNPINYTEPTGHCKDYGNGFITKNGMKMPIYIPDYTKTSNSNFNDEGWKVNEDLSEQITNLEFNWTNAIGHFGDTLEEDKGIENVEVGKKQIVHHFNHRGINRKLGATPQGGLLALEFMNTMVNNTTRNVLSVTVQEKGEQKRAIIQVGSYNNTMMKKAGKTYNKLAFGYWAEPGHNIAVKGLNDYLTTLGYGKYVEGEKHTNVRLTVDSRHANDPFVGYIGVNDDEQITITPKLYKYDNAQIISEKTILYQYYTGNYDVKYDMYNDLREFGTGVLKNNQIVKDASKQFEFSN